MSERTVELDEPVMDEQSQALQAAVERAEHAEAELAKLKNKALHTSKADTAPKHKTSHAAAETESAAPRHKSSHADAASHADADVDADERSAPKHKASHTSVDDEPELPLFAPQHEASHAKSDAKESPAPKHKASHISGDAEKEMPAPTAKHSTSRRNSDDHEDTESRGSSSTAHADPTGEHLVKPGSMDAAKQDAAQEPEGHAVGDPSEQGIEALREDAMMRHLLDSLEAGEDIGHYGRLTFAMIARHFLTDDEVLAEMTKDETCSEEDARQMLMQVEGRDYSPPRRDRIMEWQSEQEFPIIPNPHDPDCGNVYKSLRFSKKTYNHIGHYQEEKASS